MNTSKKEPQIHPTPQQNKKLAQMFAVPQPECSDVCSSTTRISVAMKWKGSASHKRHK